MYKNYEDGELLYLIKEDNEDAHNILYEKYKPIINIKVKKYINYGKKIGLEYNDLFQEGMVGLSEAIKNYSDNKDTKFASFANVCIERRLYSTLRRASRKKYAALNDSFSLDLEDDEGKTILDYLSTSESDPGNTLEFNESKKDFYDVLYKELTDSEKSVFELKMSGLDYKEISKILDKSYKSIDGTIQRLKLKIKKVMDEMNK